MFPAKIARAFCSLALTVVLGGFIAATLVRYAPGFGADERELDPRLSPESIRALRGNTAGDHGVAGFYFNYLTGLLRGDLGVSQSLGRPAAELFRERFPVTMRHMGTALALSWLLGLLVALMTTNLESRFLDAGAGALGTGLLCLPSSVLALVLVLFGHSSVSTGLALVLFPRVFLSARGILMQQTALSHVAMAKAKGLRNARIILAHVLAPAAPSLIAVAGSSVSLALAAAVPIEVVCDSPGIGQLAWQVAQQRDLPLLVNLTLLVTLMSVISNSASDLLRLFRPWQQGVSQ